jgi:hypothetical protein
MEKVDSEKQQDNILNNTVDYNESTAIMITTSTLTLTRLEKKKQKRKIKKVAKKTTKFLKSSIKDTLTVVQYYRDGLGFKYDYERLFIKTECLVY